MEYGAKIKAELNKTTVTIVTTRELSVLIPDILLITIVTIVMFQLLQKQTWKLTSSIAKN